MGRTKTDRTFKGEESGVARIEDNIVFTPFNFTEERREGHFDKAGNYIFDKEEELVQDSWIKNLDNVQIADSSKFRKPSVKPDDDEPYDRISTLQKMMSFMHKNETVIAAIKRIGAQINDLRKQNRVAKSAAIKDQIKILTNNVEELSTLADQSLFNLDREIYDKKYSDLEKLVQQPSASTSGISRMFIESDHSLSLDETDSTPRQGSKRKRDLDDDDDPSDDEFTVQDEVDKFDEETDGESSDDDVVGI